MNSSDLDMRRDKPIARKVLTLKESRLPMRSAKLPHVVAPRTRPT